MGARSNYCNKITTMQNLGVFSPGSCNWQRKVLSLKILRSESGYLGFRDVNKISHHWPPCIQNHDKCRIKLWTSKALSFHWETSLFFLWSEQSLFLKAHWTATTYFMITPPEYHQIFADDKLSPIPWKMSCFFLVLWISSFMDPHSTASCRQFLIHDLLWSRSIYLWFLFLTRL